MAVTFRSVFSVNVANGTSVVITKPTGLAVNDLMVAHIAGRFYSGQGVTPPAGWTLIIDERHTGGVWECYTAYKIAVQADVDATNFTFTYATGWVGGAIYAFSSTHLTTPIGGSASGQGTDTAIVIASITPPANCMFVTFTGWGDVVSSVSGYAMTTSDPGTWTERYDNQVGGGGGGGFSAADSALRAATTATGSITATLANSQIYAAVAIAIQPPAAAAAAKPRPMMLTGVG